jgi:Protein of unknown function (DUF4057)
MDWCFHSRRGLETKLQQCLIGSDIFADQAPGIDSKLQFSASPNGKIREVSDAKKRALQVEVEQAIFWGLLLITCCMGGTLFCKLYVCLAAASEGAGNPRQASLTGIYWSFGCCSPLQGNDIFAEKVEDGNAARSLAFSEAKLHELGGSDIFGEGQQVPFQALS